MTPPIAWSPERVTALYEQVEATLRQTAALAEYDAERAAAAADAASVRVERFRTARALRAADQARRNAARARAEAPASPEGGDAARRDRVAVIATDPAGTVLVWNRAAERLYGWRAGEVLGRPITHLTVGPEDAELAERIMAGVRSTGRWEGEFWVRRRDGTRFLAFVRDILLLDADRRPLGIVGLSYALPSEEASSAGG